MSEENQIFQFQEEFADHHFRTEIPNCVIHAQLDVYQTAVYLYIKMVAGDKGRCWQSMSTMVENTKISEKQIRISLNKLQDGDNKFGLKLIKKTARIKPDGSKDTSLITIINVWRFNGDFHKSIREGGTFHCTVPLPSIVPEGTFHCTDKQDLSEEDLSKKKQQQQSIPQAREGKGSVACLPAAVAVVFSCLENLGLSDESKTSISKAFAGDEESVIIAVEMSKEAKDPIKNLGGYIRTIAKSKPKRKVVKEEIDNQKLAKSLAIGLQSPFYIIDFHHKYVEFACKPGGASGSGQPYCLDYEQNGFEQKFDQMRRKLGFVKAT